MALLASIGVYGGFAGMMLAKPAEVQEKIGEKSATSSPSWATMVAGMRVMAACFVNVCLLLVVFFIEGCMSGGFSNWSLFVAFAFALGGFAVAAYRIFVEDVKSTNNSEASVEASKKGLAVSGTLAGLCLLGFFFRWLWGPKNTGFVNDDLHGLPDELAFIRKSTGQFLKQHFLGHA